jgi:hypothetical protein
MQNKKIYLFAIFILVVINIFAVFFIFKKYRSSTKKSSEISAVKIKFAEIKEKINKMPDSILMDSSFLSIWQDIEKTNFEVDSLLQGLNYDTVGISIIHQKIDHVATHVQKIKP